MHRCVAVFVLYDCIHWKSCYHEKDHAAVLVFWVCLPETVFLLAHTQYCHAVVPLTGVRCLYVAFRTTSAKYAEISIIQQVEFGTSSTWNCEVFLGEFLCGWEPLRYRMKALVLIY